MKSNDLATTMNSLLREFDPEKLTNNVIVNGEDWADKDAAASALEETKKSMLASYILETVAGARSGALGEKARTVSMAQAEQTALADPRYIMHLELMVAARQESNRARVRYDLGRMKLELIRSLQATLRNEMNISRFNT
ncbi:MAG: hypothetical protein Q7S87_08855 [Agitococcus sp.]|nr:hypothetical protein [Agitococcus sp.]MDO9177009.1 hypothetical protein [Agitococcus sp.]